MVQVYSVALPDTGSPARFADWQKRESTFGEGVYFRQSWHRWIHSSLRATASQKNCVVASGLGIGGGAGVVVVIAWTPVIRRRRRPPATCRWWRRRALLR